MRRGYLISFPHSKYIQPWHFFPETRVLLNTLENIPLKSMKKWTEFAPGTKDLKDASGSDRKWEVNSEEKFFVAIYYSYYSVLLSYFNMEDEIIS